MPRPPMWAHLFVIPATNAGINDSGKYQNDNGEYQTGGELMLQSRQMSHPAPARLFAEGNRKERRVAFLRALSGAKRYKRFLGSPLRYGGGKSLAVGLLVENIPANLQKMVSPSEFAGAIGGSLSGRV